MQKRKEKMKSRLDIGKLTRMTLRLLKANVKFSVFSVDQEKFAHDSSPVNTFQDSQREIRSALLNAECKKAEAFMEWQEHLRLY